MLDEPNFESLPTADDFYYDGDCEEKWVREHYLGKDIEFARKRYYTHCSLSVLHDWSHVGPLALRFYILGACRYLQEEGARDDIDVYNGLAHLLLRKLVEHPKELAFISAYVADFSRWALENHEKFRATEHEHIYGDVIQRYRELQKLAGDLKG
ncbi:hypothetical protein ACVW0Y_002747 [Pseudomonas sp. TE3786]